MREVFVTRGLRRGGVRALVGRARLRFIGRLGGPAKALSDGHAGPGLVAVCDLPATRLEDVLAGSPQLIAVTVEIREPGNTGTVIRIADAMGAAAVIAGRASTRSQRQNARVHHWHSRSRSSSPDVSAAIADLRAAGLQVATAVDGEWLSTMPIGCLPSRRRGCSGPSTHGLSAEIAALADHRVHIPMSGGAESTQRRGRSAVCLYERSGVGPP